MSYKVLMIDPPWKQGKGGKRKVRPLQGRFFNYGTLGTDVIFELLDSEIFPLAATGHVVFIWTIDKFLAQCETAMQSRGYRRHCRLIWDKGNGIAPAFTVRFSHEYLLWYYGIRLPPIAREARGLYRTVIQENARQHSRKPEVAYQMVEAMYPGAKKLDVFSRQQRALCRSMATKPIIINNKTVKDKGGENEKHEFMEPVKTSPACSNKVLPAACRKHGINEAAIQETLAG